MHSSIVLCFGIFLLISSCVNCFVQQSESQYLSLLPSFIAQSWSQPLPPALKSQCANLGHKYSTFVSVTLTQSMTSTQAQTKCSATNVCIVPTGVTLTIDNSLNVGGLLVAGGSVHWNDSTQATNVAWICAGYVVVNNQGSFVMNVLQKQSFIYIKNNNLTDPYIRTRVFGGYGNSTIIVTGRPMARTWSLITNAGNIGDASFSMLHNPQQMGWQVGDRIQLAPTTGGSWGTAQSAFILAFGAGNSVYLGNYTSSSYGATSMVGVNMTQTYRADHMYIAQAWTAHLAAEIINLSRNIIITGDDFENVGCINGVAQTEGCLCDPNGAGRTVCTNGLHTVMSSSGVMRMEYVRIEKCGQRGIMGKYCAHFHLLDECPDCSITGNAIEYGQQRAVVVHGTHLSSVVMNVVTDVRGAYFYIEDGNEMYNKLYYNVAICPWPLNGPNAWMQGCSEPGTDNGQADTDLNQSGYWAAGFANYLVGNRAANSFNGMLWQEQGIGGGREQVDGDECINHQPTGRIEGNTFHGHGRFGTYLLASVYPLQTDMSLATNGEQSAASCESWTADGRERGLPQVISYSVDYGNVFVGQYGSGDVQYRHHSSIDNDALMYWKETKNFYDGCSAHISNSYYDGHGGSMMALPSGHGTFILENTQFTGYTGFESNHHCNVGTTGALLCMPQYVFSNVTFQSIAGPFNWFYFNPDTNNGALFTLAPDDCAQSHAGTLTNSPFPSGFCSLANPYWTYLLFADNNSTCFTSQQTAYMTNFAGGPAQFQNLYFNGLHCKAPLRRLEVFTQGLTLAANSTLNLILELWQNKKKVSQQVLPYFQIADDSGNSGKQGFSASVIPGPGYSYVLSREVIPGSGIGGANLDPSWVVEFSDLVFGNRFPVDQLFITIKGKNCPSPVTSMHDRRWIWANSENFLTQMGRGACTAFPDEVAVNCKTVPPIPLFGICPSMCPAGCNNGFCDCGTGQCVCNAGFFGPECQIDNCAAAQCSGNGRCSALYLGGGLAVTEGQTECVCNEGFYGPRCDSNPCKGVTCGGKGTCSVLSANDYVCNCTAGWMGHNCETNCTGTYPTGTCRSPCVNGAEQYQGYDMNGNVNGGSGPLITDCISSCKAAGAGAFVYVTGGGCYCKPQGASLVKSSNMNLIAGFFCNMPPGVPFDTLPPYVPPINVSTAVSALSYSTCTSGCQTISNVQFTGVDAMSLNLASAPACCSACTSTVRCVGYTYNAATSTCVLKQQVISSTPVASSAQITSGLVCGQTCNLGGGTWMLDTNLPGGDLNSTMGVIASDCATACANNAYCVAYTFYQGVCLLKQWNGLSAATPKYGAVSAYMQCLSSSCNSVTCPAAPTCTDGSTPNIISAANPNNGICCSSYQCSSATAAPTAAPTSTPMPTTPPIAIFVATTMTVPFSVATQANFTDILIIRISIAIGVDSSRLRITKFSISSQAPQSSGLKPLADDSPTSASVSFVLSIAPDATASVTASDAYKSYVSQSYDSSSPLINSLNSGLGGSVKVNSVTQVADANGAQLNTSPSATQGFPIAIVAGAVAGGVLLIVLVVAGVYCYKRKNQATAAASNQRRMSQELASPTSTYTQNPAVFTTYTANSTYY